MYICLHSRGVIFKQTWEHPFLTVVYNADANVSTEAASETLCYLMKCDHY